MKHLTSKILMALVVTGFAGAAHAAVTSKAYVDKQDGDLTALTTSAKTDLVSAINSVQGAVTTINTNLGDYATSDSVTSAVADEKDRADAAYAVKATEGIANTASTKAAANETAIGTLASLTTTQKTNLVGAINEIKGILGTLDSETMADLITETDADGKYAVKATEGIANTASTKATANETAIGALASLTTTEKTTLVGAINEIKGILGTLDSETMADLITETAADAKYAVKATEGIANTAATKAAANETAIGTINTELAKKEDKSALKALAYKDTVATADIVDANVTKAKLAADVQTSLGKADTALQAAAIENLATKSEVTTGLATKQATLTGAQLDAANSGITAAKVTTYDAYNAAIEGKADAAATTAALALKANDADLGALAKAAPGACGSAANKCVLVFDGTNYSWEVIER